MAIATRKQAIFSGHTFFTILNDDGTAKQERFGIMCADVFQFTPQFNRVDVISGCVNDYGQAIKTFNIPQVAQVDITLKEVTAPVFAMQFMGEAVTQNEGAISIVGDTLTIAHDDWVSLGVGLQQLDTLTINGSTVGVDYRYHKPSGCIKIIAGGNLAVGGTPTFDATRAARDIIVIDALSQTSILAKIEWYGQDIDTKEQYSQVIQRANLVPGAPINWQSTDPQTIQLTGSSETPATGVASQIRIG